MSRSICLAVLLVTGLAQGQEPKQAELIAKFEKKTHAKYIEFGGWTLDYDQAKAKAKAEGKLLFAYFSRSYSP